ncbi:hypothetical protein ECC02_001275 [Trypanosoma cruzi]|uniref:Vesicle tethering protein Uso1/P115-like head domain-containing protein n=1 Tax=Trypanosoma cruzi TaxID=5693 RepID=A0A7J6YFJ0_TRYCR|nr:hypothetical protein ECC02_001275 [Trypanosoma cruzi]
MSFLVKALLGSNVVHPVEHEGSESPSSQQGDAEEEKQRVPTRTLIIRVQSCTVAQDRRDALKELQACPDLPYVMAAKEVSYLCNVLRIFPDDNDVVESSLAVLSGITELTSYPSSSSNYAVSEKEKRRIRDSFLHELVPEVPLFLNHVQAGSFWCRFHAVQILQRLQEHDPSAVHKLLLSSHGIGMLLDILNDNSHCGALRSEGLLLITSITATDTELQTILAFDNAFEMLFAVIKEEGGLDGGVIVCDCLTIAHNMLRNNKATQKLFCEMGCARLVCNLLEAVPERLRAAMHRSASLKNQGGDTGENMEAIFTPLSDMQNDVVFKAVSILSCVLRGAEAHQEGPAAQEAFLQSGALGPLSSLALGGVIVDDASRVEALRTLAVLLQDRRVGIERFIQLQVTTLVSCEFSLWVEEWSALRGILYVLLEIEDRVMQSAAAQVFHALLSVSVCEGDVAEKLLEGFAPSLSSLAPAAPAATASRGVLPARSGAALANALFRPIPCSRSSQKYYSALLLDRLLCVSGVMKQLLGTNQREMASSLSLRKPITPYETNGVFLAYVQYVIKCLRGQGEMDLNTLSACFRSLLRWVIGCEEAVQVFLSDGKYYKSLLQRAGQDDGPVHVRFWSAVLCAALCVAAPSGLPKTAQEPPRADGNGRVRECEGSADGVPSSPSLNRRQLLELFFNHLGGPSIFDSLLFDVKASSPMWSEPPKNAFLRPTPALYDEKMKHTLLGVIKEFNEICPSRGKMQPTAMEESDLSVAPAPTAAATRVTNTAFATVVEDVDFFSEGSLSLREDLNENLGAVGMTAPKQQNLSQVEGCLKNAEDEACNALRNVYELRVKELLEKNAALERELQVMRGHLHADAESREVEKKPEKRHVEEVKGLRENVRLLEEALSAEEEEHRLLAQSLNMLEEQLREARANRSNTTEVLELRREVEKLTEERDRLLVLVAELDEENLPMNYTGLGKTYPSPSPPPLPPPSAPYSFFSSTKAPQAICGEVNLLPATKYAGFAEGEQMTPAEPSHSLFEATGPNGFQTSPSPSVRPPQEQQQQQSDLQPARRPFERTLGIANGLQEPVEKVASMERNLFSDEPPDGCVRGNELEKRHMESAPPAGAARRSAPLKSNPFANMAGPHDELSGGPW